MILSAFPRECRLVVSGIGPEHQASMTELLETIGATGRGRCLVLFPDEAACTFEETKNGVEGGGNETDIVNDQWDVIVIDGTWAQARKLYRRYIPLQEDGGPVRVQLSKKAVSFLEASGKSNNGTKINGHQLRYHPIKWREVSTLEATRLLLGDMAMEDDTTSSKGIYPWDALAQYQIIADNAAKRQLGPPRYTQECK